MKVANVTALKALVEESGMQMDEGGRVSAKEAEDSQELLAAVRELIVVTRGGFDENAAAIAELANKPEAEMPPMPQPVTKWIFTIERVHGEMSRIIAEAA